MGKPVPQIAGEEVSTSVHGHLVYLDLNHMLKPTGELIYGTAGDLAFHLLDHHDFNTPSAMSKRKLARLHLALHAMGGIL